MNWNGSASCQVIISCRACHLLQVKRYLLDPKLKTLHVNVNSQSAESFVTWPVVLPDCFMATGHSSALRHLEWCGDLRFRLNRSGPNVF